MEKVTNILLAEDDINLGQLLQTFLKNKGFKVSLAQNGKIAFEKFNQAKYDFCIFDVMMPEMDGFTLAGEIREIDKHVPILFLTAKAMKEDVSKITDMITSMWGEAADKMDAKKKQLMIDKKNGEKSDDEDAEEKDGKTMTGKPMSKVEVSVKEKD